MENGRREYKKQYAIIRPSVEKELSHGMTVSNISYLVAKEMKLPEEECYEIALAAFLHDIGKLELAQFVRGHEDKTLIIEELRYVRRHASLGADILQTRGYSKSIVDMVRFHHENSDGTGYPKNLFRNEIPIGSRIIHVCDVFAALTANRPYRKAFEPAIALELMIDEAKQYDLRVFLAFMNVVNSGKTYGLLDTEEKQEELQYLIYGEEEE